MSTCEQQKGKKKKKKKKESTRESKCKTKRKANNKPTTYATSKHAGQLYAGIATILWPQLDHVSTQLLNVLSIIFSISIEILNSRLKTVDKFPSIHQTPFDWHGQTCHNRNPRSNHATAIRRSGAWLYTTIFWVL